MRNDFEDHDKLIEKMISMLGADKSGFEFLMVESPKLGVMLPPGTLFLVNYKERPTAGNVVAVYMKSGDSHFARISHMSTTKGVYLLDLFSATPNTLKTVKAGEIQRMGVIMCALYA